MSCLLSAHENYCHVLDYGRENFLELKAFAHFPGELYHKSVFSDLFYLVEFRKPCVENSTIRWIRFFKEYIHIPATNSEPKITSQCEKDENRNERGKFLISNGMKTKTI